MTEIAASPAPTQETTLSKWEFATKASADAAADTATIDAVPDRYTAPAMTSHGEGWGGADAPGVVQADSDGWGLANPTLITSNTVSLSNAGLGLTATVLLSADGDDEDEDEGGEATAKGRRRHLSPTSALVEPIEGSTIATPVVTAAAAAAAGSYQFPTIAGEISASSCCGGGGGAQHHQQCQSSNAINTTAMPPASSASAPTGAAAALNRVTSGVGFDMTPSTSCIALPDEEEATREKIVAEIKGLEVLLQSATDEGDYDRCDSIQRRLDALNALL